MFFEIKDASSRFMWSYIHEASLVTLIPETTNNLNGPVSSLRIFLGCDLGIQLQSLLRLDPLFHSHWLLKSRLDLGCFQYRRIRNGIQHGIIVWPCGVQQPSAVILPLVFRQHNDTVHRALEPATCQMRHMPSFHLRRESAVRR